MDTDRKQLTIGALARAAGIGVETVRYYQRRGLMPEPQRRYGSIRRYGASDVRRLRFIRMAQDLGFSLREVAELLQLADGVACEEAQEIASRKLSQIRERKVHLDRIETALGELLGRCLNEGGRTSCPLIDALAEGHPDTVPPPYP